MRTIMIFLDDHIQDAARPRLRLCGGRGAQRVWARVQPIDGIESKFDLLVEQQMPARLEDPTKAEADRMFAVCATKIFRPVEQKPRDPQ